MLAEQLTELLSVLSAAPAKIQSLLGHLTDEQLRRRPAANEFSGVEHVCHLRDIEAEGYAIRIKRILAEDQPILADLDGGRLAVERNYLTQDLHEALSAFSSARAQNLETLKNLDAGSLSRTGVLEGVGSVTLAELLLMLKEHDASHLRDIEGLVKAGVVSPES